MHAKLSIFLPAMLTLAAISPAFAQETSGAASVPFHGLVSLHDLSGSLESLVARVRPGVVQIFTTGYGVSEEQESGNTASVLSKQRSTGSGIIVTADGYIVTNAHVVTGARRVQVKLAGMTAGPDASARTLEAKIIGMDRDADIAVIKIEKTGLPHLTFADSSAIRQGQLVMAFGNPLGLEGSVSMGIVSSTSRQIKPDDWMTYIQTDAPINPGNSGGPLVDTDGRVAGINTFIFTQSGGSEGIGFAIAGNVVNDIYNQIRKDGHVHRGQLGIYAQTITAVMAKGLSLPRDWGVVVSDVAPGGPAEKAGVKIGDILATANGQTLDTVHQLEVIIYRHPIGGNVALGVIRGDQKLTIDAPVVARDDDPQRFADLVNPGKNLIHRLGILAVEINEKLASMLPDLRREYGVVVAAKLADSESGLQTGDVIYAVNGVPSVSVAAIRAALDQLKSGDPVVLQVERDSRLMFIGFELE